MSKNLESSVLGAEEAEISLRPLYSSITDLKNLNEHDEHDH